MIPALQFLRGLAYVAVGIISVAAVIGVVGAIMWMLRPAVDLATGWTKWQTEEADREVYEYEEWKAWTDSPSVS